MSNLAEALPAEQARVRELIMQYRSPLLEGAGEIAARMMEAALQTAERAAASGDVVAMIRSYEELRGFSD